MYAVKETYTYEKSDEVYPCSETEVIAYTNTEEEANEILELRCQKLRKYGRRLLNDFTDEEMKKITVLDTLYSYSIKIEEVKTITPEEYDKLLNTVY